MGHPGVLTMKWWIVNQLTRPGGPRGPQQTNYVIVQSASRPINAISGPYDTKAEAQAAQTGDNTAGNSPGSAIGGATDAAVKSLNPLAGLFQANIWIRVGEVVVGLILLGIGLNALMKGKPMAIVTGAAGVAGKAAML